MKGEIMHSITSEHQILTQLLASEGEVYPQMQEI